MKCEKCGKAAANFHYKSIVNEDTNEYHLCSDCARDMGFEDISNYGPNISSLLNYTADPFENFFDGFFGRPASLLPVLYGGTAPVFFVPAAVCDTRGEGRVKESGEDRIPESAGEEIKSRRELTALRNQLNSAVRAEEYEKAAELRDRIKAMERRVAADNSRP